MAKKGEIKSEYLVLQEQKHLMKNIELDLIVKTQNSETLGSKSSNK